MKIHIWRYRADETQRPWIVSCLDPLSEPLDFDTWQDATAYVFGRNWCSEVKCCLNGFSCDETGICHNDDWHREVKL
jgi:hypothetical protein